MTNTTAAVVMSTVRGRLVNGSKIRGLIQTFASRSPGLTNSATSAGSNVTLTSSPMKTPVPAISPSSETPTKVVGMNE